MEVRPKSRESKYKVVHCQAGPSFTRKQTIARLCVSQGPGLVKVGRKGYPLSVPFHPQSLRGHYLPHRVLIALHSWVACPAPLVGKPDLVSRGMVFLWTQKRGEVFLPDLDTNAIVALAQPSSGWKTSQAVCPGQGSEGSGQGAPLSWQLRSWRAPGRSKNSGENFIYFLYKIINFIDIIPF